MTLNVEILQDPDDLAERARQWFLSAIDHNPGRVAVCLTGGSTPERLYRLLAGENLPWERIHVFFSDERFVPPGDELSNAGMARRVLLDHVPMPAENVHAIPTETASPEESARLYEAELKAFYGADKLDASRPLFDLVLNGMGDDGHTASLFAGMSTLNESEKWVVASEPGMKPFVPRVTLTFPALESCRFSAFLVAGATKAATLARVRAGEDLPSARLKPHGDLVWLIDRAASTG
ncbi:6-phosphogluconolactonase [Flaviflagellibacter deserti]|uniref:6-phosphogluconolactonase n=1 Tax=Flaviflagellibacter deserti TaxID=2267266 RepID=A0ABV9Z6I4_9HYPH